MKYSVALLAAFIIAGSTAPTAPPAPKHTAKFTQADVLNYELTLEHILDKLYREGLANYTDKIFDNSGLPDTMHAQLKLASEDKIELVKSMAEEIKEEGAKPVEECTYLFPSTDVKAFVEVAVAMEDLCDAAYIAATSVLIESEPTTSKKSKRASSNKLSTFVRSAMNQDTPPTPSPLSPDFDLPLPVDIIYAMAAQYIVACPESNPKLPIKEYPHLALGTKGSIEVGGSITLETSNSTSMTVGSDGEMSGAFISRTGVIFVAVVVVDSGYTVQVPEGVEGLSYVVLVAGNVTVDEDTILAGPATVEVSPAFA